MRNNKQLDNNAFERTRGHADGLGPSQVIAVFGRPLWECMLNRRALTAAIATSLLLPAVALASDEGRATSVAQINLVAIKRAVAMAIDSRNVSVLYVSVGGSESDPTPTLLRSLADDLHVFRPVSRCPHKRSASRTFCTPKKGEVHVFVGGVQFLGDDLAETTLGYGFGAIGGTFCSHRFRRAGEAWNLVPPKEFAGLCKVS